MKLHRGQLYTWRDADDRRQGYACQGNELVHSQDGNVAIAKAQAVEEAIVFTTMSRALILIDFINEFLHRDGKITLQGMGRLCEEQGTLENVRKLTEFFRENKKKSYESISDPMRTMIIAL